MKVEEKTTCVDVKMGLIRGTTGGRSTDVTLAHEKHEGRERRIRNLLTSNFH